MTAEKLHDALNLLPADLIMETDRLRAAPKQKTIPWKRILPMAACFVLLVGLGMMLRQDLMPKYATQKEAAPEAPAAMAPIPEEEKLTADEVPDEPAAEAPMETRLSVSGTGREEELCIDHSHRFAQETENADSTGAYCGNTVTTVCLDGETYSLGSSDSVAMTHILKNLPYNPAEVCRCMAEFTVDTEPLSGIQVNLSEGFARCEKGQAALTEEQTRILREIIEGLK